MIAAPPNAEVARNTTSSMLYVGLAVSCDMAGTAQAAAASSVRQRLRIAVRGFIAVPGFMGPAILLMPLALFLRAHGREVQILSTFPALGGVEASARRIQRAVAKLRERTGAARVDLVAHSMGGLACRHYMDHLMEEPAVRRFISIATPHLGTRWAHLPFTRSARDMRPGNPLLAAMAERSPAPGVRCYTIRAGWDQIVWPREHGRWERHARDHELAWAEHWAVQLDPRTLGLVLALLEEPEDETCYAPPHEHLAPT